MGKQYPIWLVPAPSQELPGRDCSAGYLSGLQIQFKTEKIRSHAIERPGVTKVAWTVCFFDIKSFSGPANECSQSLIP